MPKPKLLWLGDAVAPTGFARVTHNITNRLADKWDVHILGINYPGDPHKYDKVKIYPAGTGGDIFGVGRLADLIKRVQPDMICALQDPWNIVKYLEQWRQLENRPPFVAYMPVDAPHMKPATAKALNQLTAAIFYTHFGLNEARKSGYAGAGHVVPHGVDTDVYQPVKREIARQELGMPKPAWNAAASSPRLCPTTASGWYPQRCQRSERQIWHTTVSRGLYGARCLPISRLQSSSSSRPSWSRRNSSILFQYCEVLTSL